MDDSTIKALLDAVREACEADTWSRGVELWRAQAVTGQSQSPTELKVRVAVAGALRSPTVTLWPQDEDWWCDCTTQGQACEHAAAAVIALRQAARSGKNLFAEARASGKIGYRLTRTPAGLSFHRVVVTAGREERIDATLSAIADGRVPGPRFSAGQVDLDVEAALGSRLSGVLPRQTWPALLQALGRCEDVLLDGKPVAIAPPSAPIHGKLESCDAGFRLSIEQDPSITEVFANGVVACGTALRPLGESNLEAREIEDLRPGKVFGTDRITELLTDVLPKLRERIPVRVVASNLPELVDDVYPRVTIESRREGDDLTVLATIVYGDPPIARVDGDRLTPLGGAVPVRRREAEQRIARWLDAQLGLAAGLRVRRSGQEAVDLARRIAQVRVRDVSVEGTGHRSFFMAPALVGRLRVGDGTFDVSFESVDETGATHGRAKAEAVIGAWRRGESLVPLIEGGFAQVPAEFLARFGERIADLLAARQETGGEVPPCMALDLAALCEDLEQPQPASFDKLRALAEGFASLPPAELPVDLGVTLRDYQRAGVDWLCFLRDAGLGAMLADDMGLGKTIQALCAIRGRTLVVTPTSVMHNWVAEVRRVRPSLRCAVYHGPDRKLDASADVTLTTYAILRLDADDLVAQAWDTVVLDEAQAIKSPDSQVAQAAYRIRAGFRMTLTGTPVENRLEDLWSQMHFANRGLLGGRQDFQERVSRPVVEGQPGAAARLRARIRPFVLRRKKSEVARELPPRTEVVLRCVLSDEERGVYDAIRAAMVPQVVERLRAGAGVMAALEALLRLRQACCHTALVPGQSAQSSAKVQVLLERLDDAISSGHKALVFSQWTSLLDLLEPHLRQGKIAFTRLDGSTRDREEVVREFQRQDGPPVMLVSLKAGGTGLNLTEADHVYLMDPWWNPAVEDQAADRAHRIGQLRPVLIHRLVAQSTIEERIVELQAAKRVLSEAAIGEAEAAAGLTRDDLLDVLSREL